MITALWNQTVTTEQGGEQVWDHCKSGSVHCREKLPADEGVQEDQI